jgi:hypothetical protein
MVKETLEKAAKIHLGIPIDRVIDEEERYYTADIGKYDSFIEGAKWQAKRMYSEEEVEQIFNIGQMIKNYGDYKPYTFKEALEQFKKK